MKKLFLLPFFFGSCFALFSQQFDVEHYAIQMSIPSFAAKQVYAKTDVTIHAQQAGLTTVELELLRLIVDSVWVNNVPTTYLYNDTLLRVNLPTPLANGQQSTIQVFYHGQPMQDPAGFGGFYFSNDTSVAFNLGVSLTQIPHNFGKVWFPCVDNFTDRAAYDFYITVSTARTAVCSGTLLTTTDNGNGTHTFHWQLRDPIPTYLAGMAASQYTVVRDTVQGALGSIPIALYVRPTDSLKATLSFAKLKATLLAFENRFGPYHWERVGYVSVPFTGGAMEHATNIAYPTVTINGNTIYETLWAHELSHHWFGNLATCATAEDMWLNEGFARYCEAIFKEAIYDELKLYLRNIHRSVLINAHLDDGDYYPVSGVPQDKTYGTTSYEKGATVAHSLRGHLGDSTFFAAMKQYLDHFKFRHHSSDSLKQYLSSYSGLNLQGFFDGWVFSPGWTHHEIDSFSTQGNTATVYVSQKLNNKSNYVNNNRVEITFMDNNWNKSVQVMTYSGSQGQQSFTLPFVPTLAMIDLEEKLCDATTDAYKIVQAGFSGKIDYPQTQCSLDVKTASPTDSAFWRVQMHWVTPDSFKVPVSGVRLASRYWTVEGIAATNQVVSGYFAYDARTTGAFRYLDTPWLTMREDSIVMFYRKNTEDDWAQISATPNYLNNLNDKVGEIRVDSLKFGQYCLGIKDSLVTTALPLNQYDQALTIFPNPTNHYLNIRWEHKAKAQITIRNSEGQMIQKMQINSPQTLTISTEEMAAGNYLLTLEVNNKTRLHRRFVVY